MITTDNQKEGIIAKIIEWSINNKFMVIILTLALVAGGLYALKNIALDAQPDLSDVQVIIYTEYQGQGPQIVEDQVTYPMTTKMLSVPFAQTVRGYSFFGDSFVYIIFEDDVEFYWSRSRVLEKLSSLPAGTTPDGVSPTLGPDATALGQIFFCNGPGGHPHRRGGCEQRSGKVRQHHC